MKRSVACYSNIWQEVCPPRSTFVFLESYYGRTDPNICEHTTNDYECKSNNTAFYLQQQCDGKHECGIRVIKNTFVHPCPNVPKYLETQFLCVPGMCHANGIAICKCKYHLVNGI